jgi:hypothetical protein
MGGNKVPAKRSRFPRGNVIDEEAPEIWFGNLANVDAVPAGGDLCRFGLPPIKQHGKWLRWTSYTRLNDLAAT